MIQRGPWKQSAFRSFLVLACACTVLAAFGIPRKEFLTEKEIELIQVTSEINIRVKLYLDFASARLKAAEERLSGKETEPGDPFEFFMPEDMLDGYYRIFESVMINLEDAYSKPDPLEQSKVQKSLKNLKKVAGQALTQLEILKKIAEEKDKEKLWILVNEAIEITRGALEGAESGISKEPDPAQKKSQKK